MPDVLICYEHIAREISDATLLKNELESRGISCHIMHFLGPGFYHYSKKNNRAKVVVCPWLRYDENVYHYLKLADEHHRLIDLQCEQVYCESDLSSGYCKISGEALKASHICWGEHTYKRLDAFGVDKKMLPITGAIQLDHGTKAFDNNYYSRDELASQYSLDKSKRWCLYVSTFGYANYNERDIQEQTQRFGEFIPKLVKLHKESQTATLDWIEQLLKELDCEFIYRPHPTERLCERLKNIEESNGNFHIISDYSVRQWARIANAVNLWISTSNAELISMGINYELIRPIEIPRELEVESMRQEKFITSYDDFLRFNSGKWTPLFSISDRREMLEEYYHNIRGDFCAYKKIADYIEHILNTTGSTKYSFDFYEMLRYEKKELSKRVVSLITELHIKYPQYKIIDILPLNKVIKGNLKRRVELYYQMLEEQKRMNEYLRSSGIICAQDA